MALLEKNPSDVEYENTAELMIKGRSFVNQNVYGDKKHPNRRTIIPGNNARKAFGDNFPNKARVEWQGTTYPARLSFRYRSGGGSVPVYEWYLDAETRRQLSNK